PCSGGSATGVAAPPVRSVVLIRESHTAPTDPLFQSAASTAPPDGRHAFVISATELFDSRTFQSTTGLLLAPR
ncbi:MAG: hypothetical protein AAFP84_21670, partial [Actinomycetota bacterium]